jgi:hypothetical protein
MEVEMNQIELLRREHQLIDLMAGELAAFVGEREPPEPVRFLHFRREFGRTLSLHLKREDWVVYPRLSAHACREVRDLASLFCSASAAFSAVFEAYNRAWTSANIASDWKGFQAATEGMLDSLLERIAMEEVQLYPLLAPGWETQPLGWTTLFSPRPGPARRQWRHRECFRSHRENRSLGVRPPSSRSPSSRTFAVPAAPPTHIGRGDLEQPGFTAEIATSETESPTRPTVQQLCRRGPRSFR